MEQIYYLILLALSEILGDFCYKKYANTGSITAFGIGTFGYIGVIYYLIQSLRGSTVLYVNGMWDGISTMIESAAAMIILGERLTNLTEYIGLALIIIGLFLLRRKSKK